METTDKFVLALITEEQDVNLTFQSEGNIMEVVLPFLSLFECDIDYKSQKVTIHMLQTRTARLLDNIKSFAERVNNNPQHIWHLYDFLKRIPEDSAFFMLPVTDTLSDTIVNRLKMQLLKINLKDFDAFMKYFEENCKAISEEYKIINYENDTKHNIGESIRENRMCRYCGGKMPDVTFKKKAHTISEALGNKLIVTNDDCDVCNSNFGLGIEQELIDYLQPLLTIVGVHGKNGIPEIKDAGESFSLSHKDNIVKVDLYEKENINEQRWNFSENEKGLSISIPGKMYNPQNVYRAVVKYAIGIMPDDELQYFKETINWIRGNRSYNNLPKVILFHSSNNDQKRVGIKLFIKKTENHNLPYCFTFVCLQMFQIFAIVPLSSKEETNFDKEDKWNEFWSFLKPFHNLTPISIINPNSDTKQELKFKFDVVLNRSGNA